MLYDCKVHYYKCAVRQGICFNQTSNMEIKRLYSKLDILNGQLWEGDVVR